MWKVRLRCRGPPAWLPARLPSSPPPVRGTASLPPPLPAELPLIDLMKLYEGAFLPGFQWPQPQPDGEETSEEEGLFARLQGVQPDAGPVRGAGAEQGSDATSLLAQGKCI